jgi:lipoyl(octanoyl) transferase
LDKQPVIFTDLGIIEYKKAWDYQEDLLQKNIFIKSEARKNTPELDPRELKTQNHLLFCEHPPVFTLGKSGNIENVLLNDQELEANGIEFFRTNRGGDITYHGLQQLVGYPILDLEKFSTDIGVYLRNLEEAVIQTIAEYGIKGERSKGETGVWIDAHIPGRQRKICAIGVRCSRWITMHGFALNVNTNLDHFNHIIPCGIQNKQVTSVQKETSCSIDFDEVKTIFKAKFEEIFQAELITNQS